MPAKVTLVIVEGANEGAERSFLERTTCLVGRHENCGIQIIEKVDPKWVSRYHCMLDINPPDIRIRDFGSRNGTFVNNQIIGKRNTLERQDGVEQYLPEIDLSDGDEIRIRKHGYSSFHSSRIRLFTVWGRDFGRA